MTKELEALNRVIQSRAAREAAWRKREERENRRERITRAEFRRLYLDRQIPEKRRLLGKICAWRDAFVKTKQFKRIRSLEGAEGSIDIFTGEWCHEPTDRGWSKVELHGSGKLTYHCCYPCMYGGGGNALFTFAPTDAVARRTTHAYLKKFYAHLTSGRVYKRMAEELERCL
jgi:hypothetical protein